MIIKPHTSEKTMGHRRNKNGNNYFELSEWKYNISKFVDVTQDIFFREIYEYNHMYLKEKLKISNLSI